MSHCQHPQGSRGPARCLHPSGWSMFPLAPAQHSRPWSQQHPHSGQIDFCIFPLPSPVFRPDTSLLPAPDTLRMVQSTRSLRPSYHIQPVGMSCQYNPGSDMCHKVNTLLPCPQPPAAHCSLNWIPAPSRRVSHGPPKLPLGFRDRYFRYSNSHTISRWRCSPGQGIQCRSSRLGPAAGLPGTASPWLGLCISA